MQPPPHHRCRPPMRVQRLFHPPQTATLANGRTSQRLTRLRLVDNLAELTRINGLEFLVPAFQLLERFHDRLRHLLVGGFRAANEDEFVARGDALVAVFVVETDTDDAADFRLTLSAGGLA